MKKYILGTLYVYLCQMEGTMNLALGLLGLMTHMLNAIPEYDFDELMNLPNIGNSSDEFVNELISAVDNHDLFVSLFEQHSKDNDLTIISKAVGYNGDIATVEYFIQKLPENNAKKYISQVFFYAVKKGRIDIVQKLMGNFGERILSNAAVVAIANNHDEIFQLLGEVNIDKDMISAMVHKNRLDLLEKYYDYDIEVSQKSIDYCIANNLDSIISFLINKNNGRKCSEFMMYCLEQNLMQEFYLLAKNNNLYEEHYQYIFAHDYIEITKHLDKEDLIVKTYLHDREFGDILLHEKKIDPNIEFLKSLCTQKISVDTFDHFVHKYQINPDIDILNIIVNTNNYRVCKKLILDYHLIPTREMLLDSISKCNLGTIRVIIEETGMKFSLDREVLKKLMYNDKCSEYGLREGKSVTLEVLKILEGYADNKLSDIKMEMDMFFYMDDVSFDFFKYLIDNMNIDDSIVKESVPYILRWKDFEKSKYIIKHCNLNRDNVGNIYHISSVIEANAKYGKIDVACYLMDKFEVHDSLYKLLSNLFIFLDKEKDVDAEWKTKFYALMDMVKTRMENN